MATIQLNNNDLLVMIREAVERLCEGQWYEAEPLCRLPYFVSVNFSDHAIKREDEREISREEIIDNLKATIHQMIDDYNRKKFTGDDKLKVIDRDSCIVTVCGIHPSYNQRRIHQVVVVTCFIWDGRVNIDKGLNYYINEESPAFREAKQWNEENQDKVLSYAEWKRYGDDRAIRQQRNKAEKEYYWRNHPHEPSREKVMNRMDQAYQRKERAEKTNIHDNLPDGDLQAIQDYFRDMNNKRIELEPIYEIARKAAKQALQEALTDSTNANMAAAKKSTSVLNTANPGQGNDEFYTKREDVEKELPQYAEFFKGKSIYCPCDGPQSQIFQWFRDNFQSIGLNDLVATSFSFNGQGYIIYIDHDGNLHAGNLQGDGDFRSEECQRLMGKCDIVVTNPPFTLFSDIVNQCQKYGKKFLLLGNKNAASTKAVFSLMKTGEVKYGYTKPGEFIQPEGDQIKRMGGLTRWFTNLPVKSDKKFSPTAEYDPMKHLRPDNEEDGIINVDSVRDIPYNYDGKMLVPITIFDQGLDMNEYDVLKLVRPVIGGKKKFVRVLIQKKQQEGEPALAQAVMNEVFKRLRNLI